MGKVGRPERYKTDEAKEEAKIRLEKQGKRLDSLMKKNSYSGKMTGKRAGEIINLSDKSISQYRNGRVELSYENACLLARELGTYPEYLMGYADEQTVAEYYASQQSALENAFDEEAENRKTVIQQRKVLLNSLGYEYLTVGMAAFDFLGVVPGTEEPPEPHMVKPLGSSGQPIYFSDTELDSLLTDLKDLVAFRCFQQQNRSRHE